MHVVRDNANVYKTVHLFTINEYIMNLTGKILPNLSMTSLKCFTHFRLIDFDVIFPMPSSEFTKSLNLEVFREKKLQKRIHYFT